MVRAKDEQTLNSITPYIEVTHEELEKELEELELGSQSGGTKTKKPRRQVRRT